MKNLYEITYRMSQLKDELESAKKENKQEAINNTAKKLFEYIQDSEALTERDIQLVLKDLVYQIDDINRN